MTPYNQMEPYGIDAANVNFFMMEESHMHYPDQYATIDIIDSVMYFNICDSLTTIVATDYKH